MNKPGDPNNPPEPPIEEPQPKKSPEITLQDLTLEGVPSIRMLVSDVILDVLLYMTPKYRQQMVTSGKSASLL